MKKKLMAVLALGMSVVLAACGDQTAETPAADAAADGYVKSEGVMSYEEYAAAETESEVTIETFIQAKQGWWENEGVGNATFYTQDQDGGYFLYNMPCTEAEYALLTPGTRIKVTGYKSEWAGEVEIIDASFEIEDGSYIADPVDVTAVYGTDALAGYMNQKVSIQGLTVADKGDGAAFYYSYDNSGTQGDDLYFDVELGGNTYTLTVESYLCGSDTEVYQAVEGLSVGDTINVEGFLYWYEGPQPHITSVAVQ